MKISPRTELGIFKLEKIWKLGYRIFFLILKTLQFREIKKKLKFLGFSSFREYLIISVIN